MWKREDDQDPRKALVREYRKKSLLVGYAVGQVVGTSAYTLTHFGHRFSPVAAVGSGVFLGIVVAVGSLMQTF